MDVMGSLLAYLVIGGIMGMLGQGARAVIGLRGTSDAAKAISANPIDLIQAGRLIASCLTGFLIGLAAALVSLKSGDMTSLLNNLPSWQTLLGWFAAGYAGTDFLEGFVAAYAPQGALPTSNKDAAIAAVGARLAAPRPAIATITRSTLQGLLIKALETPEFTPNMKTPIATTYPPDGLFHVWRQCVREDTPSPFIPYGMGDNQNGLSLAAVQAVTPAPKTLSDFEQKCIEPWFNHHGYHVDTTH
jgi:hypothetical protein